MYIRSRKHISNHPDKMSPVTYNIRRSSPSNRCREPRSAPRRASTRQSNTYSHLPELHSPRLILPILVVEAVNRLVLLRRVRARYLDSVLQPRQVHVVALVVAPATDHLHRVLDLAPV